MPVKVLVNDEVHWIFPKKDWNELRLSYPIESFSLDANFLVDGFLVK